MKRKGIWENVKLMAFSFLAKNATFFLPFALKLPLSTITQCNLKHFISWYFFYSLLKLLRNSPSYYTLNFLWCRCLQLSYHEMSESKKKERPQKEIAQKFFSTTIWGHIMAFFRPSLSLYSFYQQSKKMLILAGEYNSSYCMV